MNTGVAFSPGAALVALVVLLWPVTGAAQAPATGTLPQGPPVELAEPGGVEVQPDTGTLPFTQPLDQGPGFTPRVVNVPALTATGHGFVPRAVTVPALSAQGYGFVPRTVDVAPLSATGFGFVPRVVQVPVLQARGDTGGLPSIDIARPLEAVTHPQPAEPGAVVPDETRPQEAEPHARRCGQNLPAGLERRAGGHRHPAHDRSRPREPAPRSRRAGCLGAHLDR